MPMRYTGKDNISVAAVPVYMSTLRVLWASRKALGRPLPDSFLHACSTLVRAHVPVGCAVREPAAAGST